jgi:hypothetical protein
MLHLTHAIRTHSFLVRSAPRTATRTAPPPPQSPPQQSNAAMQFMHTSVGPCPKRPALPDERVIRASSSNVGRTPAKHHAVSAFFSRSRSATPRSDRPLERAGKWAGKSQEPRGALIGRAPYPNLSSSLLCTCTALRCPTSTPPALFLSRCLHY